MYFGLKLNIPRKVLQTWKRYRKYLTLYFGHNRFLHQKLEKRIYGHANMKMYVAMATLRCMWIWSPSPKGVREKLAKVYYNKFLY